MFFIIQIIVSNSVDRSIQLATRKSQTNPVFTNAFVTNPIDGELFSQMADLDRSDSTD